MKSPTTAFCHDLPANAIVDLDQNESRHLAVLRAKAGDPVRLVDGAGRQAFGAILSSNPKKATVQVGGVSAPAPETHSLVLAISPLNKKERLDWLLEKATECGVTEVVLVQSKHTGPAPFPEHRAQAIFVSALKQSGRLWLPRLHAKVKPAQLSEMYPRHQKLFGHCAWPVEATPEEVINTRQMVFAIGPEGDFSPEEIDGFIKQGFIECSLGPLRLRSETAGLAAVIRGYAAMEKVRA